MFPAKLEHLIEILQKLASSSEKSCEKVIEFFSSLPAFAVEKSDVVEMLSNVDGKLILSSPYSPFMNCIFFVLQISRLN